MMSNERYHPAWDDDEPDERKPVARLPKPPTCRYCPGRDVVSDGYGGFVHEDDYKYACDVTFREKTTFAEARL
jgi:hypothetical protein